MQVNRIETAKKLKMLEVQAEMLKTSKKKYDITDKEVSNLAADTRLVFTLSIHIVVFGFVYVSILKCIGRLRNEVIFMRIIHLLLCISRVFSSVGRMFVLSTLPDVHNELVSKQSKCDEIMKSLDDKKEFLLKCSKEQEDSLRELVQQRKEATAN